MNVYELFADVVADIPDRAALIGGTGRGRRALRYDELHRHVDAVVCQLREHGLRPGDRVLLAVPISIETYVLMLALLKAGMSIMFIDPAHSARRVARILGEWPPAAVIATPAILMLRLLMPELRRIPRQFCVNAGAPGAVRLDTRRRHGETLAACARRSADSALQSFTSGSTGEPKPVLRTHGFLRAQLEMLDGIAELRTGDIDYVTMPMFVLFNLARGVTSVIPACDLKQPGKADPAIVYAQLESERATRMIASPALLERLVSWGLRRRVTLPELKRVSTGGGPINPSLARRLFALAPNASLHMVYGSTEAEPIAAIEARLISVSDRARMRSGEGLLAGKPVTGCDLRILATRPEAPVGSLSAAQFERLAVAAGTIGEIVVTGPHVLSSYADSSRNAATKMDVDGRTWHRTGDAGYLDGEGRLWLVGRLAAAISDRRGTVFPFQVEYAAMATPGVRRAALVERDGRRTLVIEASGRVLQDQCAAFTTCVERFAVDRIRPLRRIPTDRRHNSKIDYPALHRLLDGPSQGVRLAVIQRISDSFRWFRRLTCTACHAFGRHLVKSRLRHDHWSGESTSVPLGKD